MFEATEKSHGNINIEWKKEDIFLLLQDFFLLMLFFMLLLRAALFTAKNYCLNLPRITYTRVRYYNHYYDVYVCRSFSCYIALIV
jgi:hypothetical protein